MKHRRPAPPKKAFPLSKVTVLLVLLAGGYLMTMKRAEVTQWVRKMSPMVAPLGAPWSSAPVSATAPGAAATGAAQPGAATSSIPYDECSAFGRDSAAYVVCEDHKRKVEASRRAAKEREKVFHPPPPVATGQAVAVETGGKTAP
jgi:hypothetical protein